MNIRGTVLGLAGIGVLAACQYSRSPDVPSTTQTTGTVVESPTRTEPSQGTFTPYPVTAERQRPQKKPVTTKSPTPQEKTEKTSTTPQEKTTAQAPEFETHEMIPPPTPHTRAPDADNTRNNTRDGDGASVTPFDQGNSADETKITAAIRKEMMLEKSLSFTAKNAKVITQGKNVTLRGAVKSEAERATIEAIARRTDGVAAVVNQLEVKN